MKIYFSADWHINHSNIIKYSGRTLFMSNEERAIYEKLKNAPQHEQRKFIISKESVQKMNEIIIDRCNERVKKDDQLFIIGDFCFKSGSGRGEGEPEKAKKYIEQINCKNITFVEGNHDKKGRNSLRSPIHSLTIKLGGKRIYLVHNPEHANVDCDLNLTGHVHTAWEIKRIRRGLYFSDCINVGVDVWDFYPITINEILSHYAKWLKNDI